MKQAKFGVNHIGTIFFWLLVIGVFYLLFRIFSPFLNVILMAALLAAIFYPIHRRIEKAFKKSKSIAAFLSTLLVFVVIVIPVSLFLSAVTIQSVSAYQSVVDLFSNGFIDTLKEQYTFIADNQRLASFLSQIDFDVKGTLIEFTKTINTHLFQSAASLFKGAISVIINLLFLIIVLFFAFRDGKDFVKQLIHLSPLFNKYDKQIIDDLRTVSVSAIGSTLLAALAQGILGGIGFMIVGVPGLFLGVAIAIVSLIPLIGAAVVWLPVGIVLLLTGQIWQAIFILLWGSIVISFVDNIIRAAMIKGTQKIHPLWILFSVLGGVPLFGALGIIYGPAILAFAYTLVHIYQLEYNGKLNK